MHHFCVAPFVLCTVYALQPANADQVPDYLRRTNVACTRRTVAMCIICRFVYGVRSTVPVQHVAPLLRPHLSWLLRR